VQEWGGRSAASGWVDEAGLVAGNFAEAWSAELVADT
jgi:hypothetical protein